MTAATHHDMTPLSRLARDRLLHEGRRLNALVALAAPQPVVDGPLNGLRFVVKDMFSWPGHAYSRGLHSTIPYDGKPAVLINQLVADGAELLGFAEMTPLAYEPSGANAERGRPLNPLDSTYICGGSSSGSAVLTAAGLVDFAVGSDTAGSLRIPAQCCGLVAWKPSFGLFCRAGSYPLAPSLDTLGFLARDVATLQRIGEALVTSPTKEMRRIAFATDLEWPLESDAAVARGAAAGFALSDIALQPILTLCDDVVLTLLQREAYDVNQSLIAQDALDPVLARRLSHGAKISADSYRAARAGLAVLQAEIAETLFDKTDIIALPVMPCATPLVTACEPDSPDFSARTLYELSRYTRFVNALGAPAVALPLPTRAGQMPRSLQLIARPGTGLSILRVAHSLEQSLKGFAE